MGRFRSFINDLELKEPLSMGASIRGATSVSTRRLNASIVFLSVWTRMMASLITVYAASHRIALTMLQSYSILT